MIITGSDISLNGRHSLVEQENRQESLRFWRDGEPSRTRAGIPVGEQQDRVSISAQAQSLFAAQAQVGQAAGTEDDSGAYALSDADKQKIALIEKMLEMLTGKKVKLRILDPEALSRKQVSLNLPQTGTAAAQGGRTAARRFGWGLAYDLHQTRTEQERTTLQAAGQVRTADGREIRFNMDVSMSRHFVSRQDVRIRAGDQPVDPLVIRLSGDVGTLTDRKYSFDIDSDGSDEQISFAASGSGFLALDRNGDGMINDGGELFGPESGNGFDDLAKLDSDGNRWIDENDPVFSKLRIWMKDETGADRLVALGQAGVGAIYLGNVSTEFAVKDAANTQQGQVRRSGMFLWESGSAGVMQQIDLAV